jgi:hypothetical protein
LPPTRTPLPSISDLCPTASQLLLTFYVLQSEGERNLVEQDSSELLVGPPILLWAPPSDVSADDFGRSGDGRYDRSEGNKRTVVLPVSSALG